MLKSCLDFENCIYYVKPNDRDGDYRCNNATIKEGYDKLGYCPFINGLVMRKYCKYFEQSDW